MRWMTGLLSGKVKSVVFLSIASVVILVVFGLVYSRIRNREFQSDDEYIEAIADEGRTVSDPYLAKAVFSVSGLTCSSCILEIKTALSKVKGVERVFVDLDRGKAQVYFNSSKIRDTRFLAEEITQSGYPARVVKVLPPDELARELRMVRERSDRYVVSVGAKEVPRGDFEIELNAAMHQYRTIYGDQVFQGDSGETLVADLKVQCLNRLVSEAIMLQEVSGSEFVNEKNYEKEFQEYLTRNSLDVVGLETQMKQFGYTLSYFRQKFENQVLIQDYFDRKILISAAAPLETPRLIDDWYNAVQARAEIIYYDKDLEELVESSSAAAGCCAQ